MKIMGNIRTILAIETSCDETAAAVIESGTRVLSSIVVSQIPLHKRYGGVIPEIAARAHTESILTVVETALEQAYSKENARQILSEHIDAIAVTHGPGLIGSLLVGVSTARTLCDIFDKPLIPVHHILGHVYSNFLAYSQEVKTEIPNSKFESKTGNQIPSVSDFVLRDSDLPMYPFPFLTLVASGGHTELILSKSHANHQLVGETRDDAAGEAFDKAAAVLGLPYPGGPHISALAKKGNPTRFSLPRGLARDSSGDFSFSGLKTAFLQLLQKLHQAGENIESLKVDLAASFQAAVVESLVTKTMEAAERYSINRIALAGGVAANTALRDSFAQVSKEQGISFSMPDFSYCTDNAAMIGAAGFAATLVRGAFPWYNVEVMRNPELVL